MNSLATLFFSTLLVLTTTFLVAEKIKVLVTSQQKVKVSAVTEAFEESFPNDEIEIISYTTDSGVSEQPIGYKEALRGATNRIISIENYIEKKNGDWKDIGLVMLTQPVKFSEEFITDDSATVGENISKTFQNRTINPHDWHREKEFGGVSRKELLKEAIYKLIHKEEILKLKSQIAVYPDFPKKGILFQDLSPVLNDGKSLQTLINLLAIRYQNQNIEGIIGLEARGFIIGAALAYQMGVPFIPVRKAGKIPGPTYTVDYEKEYGTDSFSLSKDAIKKNQRLLIVDDLIATGGSARAAIELVQLSGGTPVEFASILEIPELKGRETLQIPTFNLIDNEMKY